MHGIRCGALLPYAIAIRLGLPDAPPPFTAAAAAGQGAGDAVELFAQRAAASLPGFRVTADNLADVVRLCQRLDGIPTRRCRSCSIPRHGLPPPRSATGRSAGSAGTGRKPRLTTCWRWASMTRPPTGADSPAAGLLTSRELEIAGLVGEGMSNRKIAEKPVISKLTVDAHIAHIFSKLDISSRLQLISWLRDQMP